MRQRTLYTDGFRSEAIDLAISSDFPLSEIARNLGGMIGMWKNECPGLGKI